MTPLDSGTRPGEKGFVLIGVVIFVLALTIIGLSLFSLSSYEAQFLQRSLDSEQAFQSAVGGLERAKFALCSAPFHLESVGENLPREGVVSAVAIQIQGGVPDSTGPVRWVPGETVLIRVTAEVNAQRRIVEGRFDPGETQDYYSQLVAVGGGIVVETQGASPGQNQNRTAVLDGPVRESSAGLPAAWLDHLSAPLPPVQRTPEVPVPSAEGFIAQHLGDAHLPDLQRPDLDHSTYLLDASGSSGPAYFRSPDESSTSYSLFDQSGYVCEVQVRGCAVWLFPRGVRFDYPPTIRSAPGWTGDACLVIVAGPGGPDLDPTNPTADAGIYLEGGLEASIPVVLVSNRRVLIWQWNAYGRDESAPEVSIFAGAASFLGPAHPNQLYLGHPVGGQLDNHYLDLLMSHDALPDIGHHLSLVAGTWHASSR